MKRHSSRIDATIYVQSPTSESRYQNKRPLSFSFLAPFLTREPGPDQQGNWKSRVSICLARTFAFPFIAGIVLSACPNPIRAQVATQPTSSNALYKQASAPIERRVEDLLSRMTLEEKVRQLDLYSGATALVDKHTDGTHANADAIFLPDKAQALWGDLGVGAIHDLNPTPEQANAIQQWVIKHNRLQIPTLFIEEGLHGFDTGTVFPASDQSGVYLELGQRRENWRSHRGRSTLNRCGHDSCAGPGSR